MTNELSSRDRALLRLGVLTVLQGRVSEAVTGARSEAQAELRKGDRLTVSHPDDQSLSIADVSITRPKPVAKITDRAALDDWIATNYPAKTEPRTKIIGSQEDVLAVLREHAPYYIEDVVEVCDWARNELLLKSAAAGQAIGYGCEIGEHAPPGIEVSTPDGQLRVNLSRSAADIVDQMWLDHRIDMDGNLLELPAGGAE